MACPDLGSRQTNPWRLLDSTGGSARSPSGSGGTGLAARAQRQRIVSSGRDAGIWPGLASTLRTFASPVERYPFEVIETWVPSRRRVHTFALQLPDHGRPGHRLPRKEPWAVWEADSGRLLRKFPVERAAGLALSAGGEFLAAGSEDGRIFVWDVAGGEPIAPLKVGHSKIHALAFASDPHRRLTARTRGLPSSGVLLASCDAGGEVIVWDLHGRIPRSYCRGSLFDVYAVAFSPDGTTLASCGRGEVKLWDLATGQLLLDLKGGNYLVSLAFAQDGRRLAVAENPGSAIQEESTSGKLRMAAGFYG